MAAYISFQPTDFFKTVLWTGNDTARSITGVGFQPDMTWVKARSIAENHALWDAVRGAGSNKAIATNGTQTESSLNSANYGYVGAFESDGFTLAAGTGGGNAWDYINLDTKTYAAWNWKAGTTTGIAGSPSITPDSYSFNATSGFSIIAYTGTGSAATLPHGLGVAPDMMIIKSRTVTTDWGVYHQYCNAVPEDYTMILNTTAQAADNNLAWNDTAPTSTLFSVNAGDTNASSKTHVAYCFASKKGYSKFGKYNGNGNFDGPFVYTGFRPAFVMIKTFTGSSEDWKIIDDKRSTYNVTAASLDANEADAEVTSYPICDFTSNGFKIRSNRDEYNGSTTRHYIYAAFAEFPTIVSSAPFSSAFKTQFPATLYPFLLLS